MPESILRALLVGAGGFLGSVGRYGLGRVVQRLGGADFPYGTLAVNVLGSFVIGLVVTLSLERGLVNATLRLFLTVGICGGFTTMSTFSYETLSLLGQGSTGAALGNVSATIILCLAGTWLGAAAGRLV
ncbi:MAG: fluoride efflux transporter CrcB [Candidatus Binatia bacterium]